jgi:hypothetical protein
LVGLGALLHVQVRPLSYRLIEWFKTYAAGGDDLLVHVALPSVDSLHAFLMDNFTGRSEVVAFRSSIICQHARRQVIEPLDL